MPGAGINSRLVADVGGTHSRLALFDPGSGQLQAVSYYTNRDFDSFEQLVQAWLDDLDEPAPATGCLAVAAPPAGDRVEMLNMDWSFSISALATSFDLAPLRCINDFEANAHALPYLAPADLACLAPGESGDVLACVGPGTGLGGATLRQTANTDLACASEPGHMGLSPGTAMEVELFRVLLAKHRDVYAELLLSGPGLVRLYQAMAEVQGASADTLSAADITNRARSAECDTCMASLDTFCALLGSVCGDYILANGAYGGLYLAGGIVPRILEYLTASTFHQRMVEKGEMQPLLEQVPCYAITGSTTGLIGAAHAPLTRPAPH